MPVFLSESALEKRPTTTARPAPDTEEWLAAMTEAYAASDAATRLTGNTFSRQAALTDAYANRIRAIHAATGVELENPMTAAPDLPASVDADTLAARAVAGEDQETMAARLWDRQTAELARRFPDRAALIRGGTRGAGSILDDARGLARAADGRLSRALADPALGAAGRFTAALAGGVRGALRDPVQVATLFAGAPEISVGRTALIRIGQTVLREGLVNAGAEAALQPEIQAWRAEAGLDAGFGEAATQVGLAGALGGAVGGSIGAVRELWRALKLPRAGEDAAARAATGEASPADLDRVAADTGTALTAEDRAVAARAAEEPVLDRAAAGDPPPGVTDDEARRLTADAIRAAEAPDDFPAAIGPVQKAARDPAEDAVVRGRPPADAGGSAMAIAGRPVAYRQFDPADLTTDAATYQYKRGGDAAGVTERLAGVTRWDPIASGKVIVHERTDGRLAVADGHQRLGLATRLKAEGDTALRLDGYLLREADGWTPADVRALAAKKNLQEGSGTALDAARIMRDRPDILDDALPTTAPMIRRAQALARLSPDAWGLTVNGLVPENQAALVGEMVADPGRHAAVLRDLARHEPGTEREARLLVQEILAAGVVHETQTDLFGSFDVTRTLIAERVKVLDRAMADLRADKRVFASLAANADVIEAAGNALDRDGNRARAVTADGVAALLERLARAKGSVSDALTRHAEAVAGGRPVAAAARAFLGEITALVDGDGFGRLMREAGTGEATLAPARTVEPATAEAVDLASAARPAEGERDGGARANIMDRADRSRFFADRPERTLDEIYAVAPAHQARLNAAGEAIAAATGATYKAAKIKLRETAETKMVRKGYASANDMTDIVRGGFMVQTPAQADRVVADLGSAFEVLDEKWTVNGRGYFDRKVLVRFEDGTIGEVQMWEPHVLAAKEGAGTPLYNQWRALDPSSPEALALEARQKELYSAALRGASPEWAAIVDTSSGPNSHSKYPRQYSSDTNAPVSQTSWKSTLDQPAPGASMAKASDLNSTAGRKSQLMNRMGESSSLDPTSDAGAVSTTTAGHVDDATLWDKMPDGEDGAGRPRFTDEASIADRADQTDLFADLTDACKPE